MANEKLITLDNLRRFKQQLDQHGGGGGGGSGDSIYMHSINLNPGSPSTSENVNINIMTKSPTPFTLATLFEWFTQNTDRQKRLHQLFLVDFSSSLEVSEGYYLSSENSLVFESSDEAMTVKVPAPSGNNDWLCNDTVFEVL